VIALLLACTGAPAPAPPPPRPPDVLVVVLDTARADAFSAYGNPRPTSPQLDALAAAGVLFEDATAPGSWTWPSHASLFTGEFPWVHGAHFGEPGEGALALEPDPFFATAMRRDLPTLAERFAAAGYRTVALSANRLLDPALGLTRGFEDARTLAEDELVVAAAGEALAAADDRPIFLFVNLFGAHAPWFRNPVPWVEARRAELDPETAPEWVRPYLLPGGIGVDLYKRPTLEGLPLAQDFSAGSLEIPPEGLSLLRDLYEGEISRVDYRLHQLLSHWSAGGRADSVVAVTSDHGEYLGERHMLVHSRTVYPEVTHVPLVVVAPGRLPAGVRVSAPVQMHDLHDTVLELAGLELAGPQGGGDSLVGVAKGAPRDDLIQAAAWRDTYWAEDIGGRFDSGWRLYRRGGEAAVFSDAGALEYYTDPLEMARDRAGELPERARALREAAGGAFPEAAATELVGADPETLELLKVMGYTGE
jgi:arylsulfatase A-like enzyme